jgi:hypothetical protein
MARGSDQSGGGGGAPASTAIEILGGGGSMDSRGKTILNKKYFVTSVEQLDTSPIIEGYLATNISYTRLNDTAYEQNVTYESQSDKNGPGTTNQFDFGVKGTFEMFCGFESKPIELHPRLDKLTEDFGGYFTFDGYAKWPPKYTPTDTGGLGGGGGPINNPLFGVTKYKEISLVLRHSYFIKTLDASVWESTGKIVDTLPGGIPVPPGEKDKDGKEIKRQWMMQAPAISKQGGAYQIVREYVMLDSKGMPDGLYEKGTVPGVPP